MLGLESAHGYEAGLHCCLSYRKATENLELAADAPYGPHVLAPTLAQVMDTLAEIQERHEAVKELEKSLLDLHQIFLDMAVLVEAQGEMLDNIEAQVGAWPKGGLARGTVVTRRGP